MTIILHSTGELEALEFIEEDFYCFKNDGTVHYASFEETDLPVKFNKTAFCAKEFIEFTLSYLTDESDICLTDESGNNLIAIV